VSKLHAQCHAGQLNYESDRQVRHMHTLSDALLSRCRSAVVEDWSARFPALSHDREITLTSTDQGPPHIRLPNAALGVWNATQGYPGEGPESGGAMGEKAAPRKRGLMNYFFAPDPKQARSGDAAAVLLCSPLLEQSHQWTCHWSSP
jgi:hypothetical protein